MEPGTSNYKSFTLPKPKQCKEFVSADPQAHRAKSHHKVLHKITSQSTSQKENMGNLKNTETTPTKPK
jgi:hypothetical protein